MFAWMQFSAPSWPWLSLVLACGIFVFFLPAWWLVAALALVPVVDQAPYTGNAQVPESTALLGALILSLALRALFRRADGMQTAMKTESMWLPRWHAGSLFLMILLGCIYLIGMARGIGNWPLFDANSRVLFTGDTEALRVASGVLLALWCLPFLALPALPLKRLPLAAALGLLLIASAVLLERISFTDLTDFSSDYRTTGPFWEMHVGGAALDAALVLTFPFAVWLAMRTGPTRWLGGLAGVLGTYAVLVGFTRSTYLALFAEGVVMVALGMALRRRQADFDWKTRLPLIALLALALAGMFISFPTSGYRGLFALCGFASCIWMLVGFHPLSRRSAYLPIGLAIGAALLAVGIATEHLWSKAVYAQIPAAALLCAAATLTRQANSSARGATRHCLAIAATFWCGLTAVRLATHWGSSTATGPMTIAVVGISFVLVFSQIRRRDCWSASLSNGLPVAAAIACIAMTVAVFSNYYIAQRFGTVGQDMQGRVAHWRMALSAIDTPAQLIFGLGSGQFPNGFRWQSMSRDLPGDYRFEEEEGQRMLRLQSPRQAAMGFGELFRLNQQLDIGELERPAVLTFRARTPKTAALFVDICRKHLIYTNECVSKYVELKRANVWETVSWTIGAGSIGRGAWYKARPLVLSFAAAGGNIVDVDDVSLVDANGVSVVDNGDFERGAWRWFPSSDKHHLPWHAKNIFLHLLIEHGMLGLMVVSLALLGATTKLVGRAREHPYAAPLLAGGVGLLTVGLFDSIIDAPRIAFMFVLWIGVALSLSASSTNPKHLPA